MTSSPSHAPCHDPADFAARLTAAEDWLGAAVDAQQEGDWVLTDVEHRILADVVTATNPLHGGGLPPHIGDSVYVRVGRISNWAGVLRLAARAGGWELFSVTGVDPSGLDRPIGMADMLSGIYALAEQAEKWRDLVLATAQNLNTAGRRHGMGQRRTVEQTIHDLHPRFGPDLALAEGFFTGPGSLEDLPQFLY